jgi:hypothetical protein
MAPLLFADTFQAGIYTVTYLDEEGAAIPGGSFAVNFYSASESNIQPSGVIRLGQTEVTPTTTVGQRELWVGLLLLGLALLMLEWWIAHRRGPSRTTYVADSVGRTLK